MKRLGQLRIIGGQWKRRQIRFPPVNDLRPSADATRETVFNWLRNDLLGSVCLDLYAGSGAFGFEVASRGAATVVMVERHRQVIQSLRQTRDILNAENLIEIHHATVLQYLQSLTQHTTMRRPETPEPDRRKFDVVFMDPPFRDTNLGEICQSLISCNCLNDDALIYIESQKSNSPLPIPSTWHIIRESQRGRVQSTLITTSHRNARVQRS